MQDRYSMFNPKYKRILLKLSGRALMGETSFGIDTSTLEMIAQQIKKVKEKPIEGHPEHV